MSLAEQLIDITDLNRRAVESIPQMQDMLNGRFSRQRYVNFLILIYPIVSNFCPLIARAAAGCADRYDKLRDYLYDHIQEERGHERIILDDLESMEFDASGIPYLQPKPPVQAILGYNYHAIDTVDPHAILGMIYVLEIMSCVYGGKVADAISQTIRLPLTQGFTFLTSHAELDEDHMGELRAMVQCVHAPELQNIIVYSVRVNFYLFRQVLGYSETL